MTRTIVCVLALLFAVDAANAEPPEPGRWRVITTTLSGPPAPPQVAMRCLTAEQVADLGKTFGPQVSTVNSDCERIEFQFDPSGLKWRLQCRGQINIDVAGQFVFESATRYSAMVVTRATMIDVVVQNNMVSINAERVGPCD